MTDFGLVEFLLLEPARVSAAVPKCFYHQTDHWTGSVVQGAGPELWNWEGRYFFDKARGMGGVYVQNFRIGGEPADPRALPGFPPEYQAYFGPGGGGAYTDTVAAVPECAAKVDTPRRSRRSTGTAGGTRSRDRACCRPQGRGPLGALRPNSSPDPSLRPRRRNGTGPSVTTMWAWRSCFARRAR